MSSDFTQAQGGEELQRSLNLSQQRGCPPCEVPGYEPRRFLGSGAYGEVWVAIDRTTGRQVAIKFYLHRGGLDWSLLAHEVEKLAFLSADRYVVQLLDVGWDSEPPYYVMEYVENGSLDERLDREGRIPPAQATSLFREIAVGLMHSHGKGVLHCDLKPANILLDQDGKPRLADFGQSRLSNEQTPALGTLFYMAPEQADSQAMPDARWDVYALGAIFYAMLTGHPPHRRAQTITEIESAPHLDARLDRYRRLISKAPPATEHRSIRGVDKRLAEIIDRCLSADPQHRYPTVQAVLGALDARERRRSLRPLVVLGAVGPILLIGVMSILAWLWFNTSLGNFDDALTESTLKGLHFAAVGYAQGAGAELQSRFYDVEEAARDTQVIETLLLMKTEPHMNSVLKSLSDPAEVKLKKNDLVEDLRSFAGIKTLEARLKEFDRQMSEENKISFAWFITDARGNQVARWYRSDNTLGTNVAWRSFFYGGPTDQPDDWRPAPGEHVKQTQISSAYHSHPDEQGKWIMTISAPIYNHDLRDEPDFLGIVGVSFQIADNTKPRQTRQTTLIHMFEEDRQFAILVDARNGPHAGLILNHPLYQKILSDSSDSNSDDSLKRFEEKPEFRVAPSVLADLDKGISDYSDPIAQDEGAAAYRQFYLAAAAPISIVEGSGDNAKKVNTGLMIIVQDPYRGAIGGTLGQLRRSLVESGLGALAVVGIVIIGMWWLVVRMFREPTHLPLAAPKSKMSANETLPLTTSQRTKP
jgi:eukaryotic-like serine/threonine-protein kinase